jgi:hypothetical protein
MMVMPSMIGAEFNMTANTSSLSGTIFATIAALLASADCTSAAERVAIADSSYCLRTPCPPDSTVRDLQDHGAPVAQGDHQSGDDRDSATGTLPRLGQPLVLGREFGSGTSINVSNDSTSRYVSLVKNKSIALDLPGDVSDVFVANPKIANVVLRSKRRAFVIGTGHGQTNVFFYNAKGQQIDGLNISVSHHEISERLPAREIKVVRGAPADELTYECTPICAPAEEAVAEKAPPNFLVIPTAPIAASQP